MRRSILAFLFLSMAAPYTYAAAVLDHFAISPYSNTAAAGSTLVINSIIARDNGDGMVLAYNGNAYLTVSSGTGTFAVAAPISFSGGNACVGVTLYAAGSINVIVTDGAVSNVAGWANVTPLAAQSALFLRQSAEIQEVLTPGMRTGPGFVEMLQPGGYAGVTLSAGLPVAVSIVAVDQYYNPVTGTGWIYSFKRNGVNFSTPATNPATGITAFSWTPTVSSNFPEPQDFNNNFNSNPAGLNPLNAYNYITVPTACFMWTEAPATVVAGGQFNVTVTATTTTIRTSAVASWANYKFSLNPLLFGTTNPGHGTLQPGSVQLSNGSGVAASSSYNYAETIRIVPAISDASAAGKTFNMGGYATVQILPAAPALLSLNVSPANIQALNTAKISATVTDAYYNAVTNTPVTFNVMSGTGGFTPPDDAPVATASAMTNGAGTAVMLYKGGMKNESAMVRVSVGSVAPQDTIIHISVAPTNGKEMFNVPNPFNPHTLKTNISYYLKGESKVEIKIYDAFGRLVFGRTINPGEGSGDFANATSAGGANFLWDGRNGEGSTVGNGIYTVMLTATNDVEVQKFTRRVGVLK